MSTLSLTLIPGYQFPLDGSVDITYELLNLLAKPTINLEGSIGSVALADGSVTTVKIADNAIAASTTGRAKMQDGFFSADATGRAKFVAGFFGASDATSLAIFADAFWTADTAGRNKFAAGFVTGRELNASASAVVASCRNLIAKNNSGTPNSKVDVTADEIVLKDSSSRMFLARSVSLTIDIALGVALNGLETGGTESASHWYYLWLISDGTNVRGVLEDAGADPGAQPAGPDLSGGAFTGYTYQALFGVVRNDGSSNFVTFYQQDRTVFLNDTNLFTAKTAGASATYEAYSAGGGGGDVDLRTVIPPNAKRLRGTIGGSNSGVSHGVSIAANASGLGAVTAVGERAGSSLNGFFIGGGFDIPLQTAQTFYWQTSNNGARSRCNVSGYAL